MNSKCRCCRKNPDAFSYISGKYTTKDQRANICDYTKRARQAYFGMKLEDQNKLWAPRKMSENCTKPFACGPVKK